MSELSKFYNTTEAFAYKREIIFEKYNSSCPFLDEIMNNCVIKYEKDDIFRSEYYIREKDNVIMFIKTPYSKLINQNRYSGTIKVNCKYVWDILQFKLKIKDKHAHYGTTQEYIMKHFCWDDFLMFRADYEKDLWENFLFE